MPKRLRDGPVVLQNKRQCPVFEPIMPGLKRKRDSVEDAIKRIRSEGEFQFESSIGKKRSVECFDHELQHLEKRMRATVPTAEEAIAFLLPHIVRLRGMYNESQYKVTELTRAYLIQEKKKLESEVVLANYRAALAGPKPFAVESRA